MAKIIIILAGAFLSIAVHADTIVFDTFGPGDSYDPMHSFEIGGGGNMEEIAAQFSPSATGNLANVTLGLTFFNGSNPAFRAVSVFLYGDAGGSPDNADQTFLDSVTPTSLFDGMTNNSVVSFSVAGNVPVTAGSVYYLVLKPSSFGTADAWMVSSPAVSGSAFASFNDSTWAEGNTHTLPAFRLTIASPVPDSGNAVLLLLSSLGALLVLHSQIRKLV